jgi:predicted short-subunit dehydrogenase-like oxidoreductase (DUF2520 family)
LKVGIIGAGKLGCSIAIGLQNSGFEITGVCSKSQESHKYLADRLNISVDNSLAKTVKDSEVVFITVPDGEIEKVALQISSMVPDTDIYRKTFFHCSGALTSDVLSQIAKQGGYTGSFHPIQTFADRESGWGGLQNIYFGFEGDREAENCATIIVNAFNGNIISVKKENKPLYHAAACILSNYMVTLSFAAGELFENIGIDPVVGIRAFKPLIDKTLDNISRLGIKGALTGPISRGDSGVIGEHLKALEEKKPDLINIYKALGNKTVELAIEKGSITTENAEKLYSILK